jgi:isocitrate dehydrogenase (NAD+)
MPHRVTLIPGDGIGPEVIDAGRRVLEASGVHLDWDVQLLGQPALDAGAPDAVPPETLVSIRRNRVALKGPVTTRADSGFRSPNIGLRRALDLYVQVRPVRSLPGAAASFSDVDVVVIRETTEDLYAGIEYRSGSREADDLAAWLAERGAALGAGSGLSIKGISPGAVRRAMQFAIDWARRHGRRRVTVVHKATVMRATDGLFLEIAIDVGRDQSGVDVDDGLVDEVAMRLVRRPDLFDVLATSNLYGDILSDLAAGLVGGPGIVPGANYGPDAAVFEAAHGSAPRHAGCDRANPIATILSGALMLRHLGEEEAASRVDRAVADVVADGRSVTYDLKAEPGDPSAVGTRALADAVIDRLA